MNNPIRGVGYCIAIPSELIREWNNDSKIIHTSSAYCCTKISGAYMGNTYTEYLVSAFRDDSHKVYCLGTEDGKFGDLCELAFTTSTVASAHKLRTARKIFGQPFDGTVDISSNATINNLTVTGNFDAPTITKDQINNMFK